MSFTPWNTLTWAEKSLRKTHNLFFFLLLLCVGWQQQQQEKEEEEEAEFDYRQNIYQSEKAPCPSAYSSNHFKSQCDFIEEIVVKKSSFDVWFKYSESSAAFTSLLPLTLL